MEYLILGILTLSPMTGYELQQFIKQNLALICSHSAGSVQTALTKLEKSGQIIAHETLEGKRRKKIFSITESGRSAFSVWVAQPMQADKVKNMELSRLFFLGLAQPKERILAIQEYISQIEQTREILCAIRERFRNIDKSHLPQGTNWQEVFLFQEYTIAYGIAAAEFEQNWYSNLLCQLEEQP